MSTELSEKFKVKALNELREDDLRKKQALEQFREWISKQGHIKNCRTDDNFLLRFLRVKKYTNASAFKMLENFLARLQLYPNWFKNLYFNDERIMELYECGFIFPLKERDENGCRVIMIQASKLDTNKFTMADVLKIINFVIFTLLEEDETQISGFVYIFDNAEISFDFISMFSLIDLKNYMSCIENAIPCRQKCGIWINLPNFAVKLLDFIKSLVNKKLRDRGYFYHDAEKLNNHVDLKILPKELGGQVPISEMMADFKEIALKMESKLRTIEEIKIDLDYMKNCESGDAESFRKLEID
ncbi:hypothetical protein PVAND_005852 [Polypedilum vanderplanki]|uniref:CRAL-TRIO domain-containing protein n=1 Tax=Polypedilum vanderplanki TaxID=319348 RepID=A0A9J6C2A7_POLVA|nr:hypothetical protein PVAND_005852 [Polypedilum vanderplanki]